MHWCCKQAAHVQTGMSTPQAHGLALAGRPGLVSTPKDGARLAGHLGLAVADVIAQRLPVISSVLSILKDLSDIASDLSEADDAMLCNQTGVRSICETLRFRMPLVAKVAAGTMRHSSVELAATLQHAVVGAYSAAEEARNIVYVWCSLSKVQQLRSASKLTKQIQSVHERLRHRLDDIMAHEVHSS